MEIHPALWFHPYFCLDIKHISFIVVGTRSIGSPMLPHLVSLSNVWTWYVPGLLVFSDHRKKWVWKSKDDERNETVTSICVWCRKKYAQKTLFCWVSFTKSSHNLRSISKPTIQRFPQSAKYVQTICPKIPRIFISVWVGLLHNHDHSFVFPD